MRFSTVIVCMAAVLFVLPLGCSRFRRAKRVQPTTARSLLPAAPKANPILLTGTVSLRSGLAAPANATVEIVVGRRDLNDANVALHSLGEVHAWPARFDFTVTWPNVPELGEKKVWKASPPDLAVYARITAAGRTAFISDAKVIAVENSDQPVELILVPARE